MQNPDYYNNYPNIENRTIQPPTTVSVSRNRQDLYLSGGREGPVTIIGAVETNSNRERIILEYNLEPIEALEFDRIVDGKLRTFRVMFSREFGIGSRDARMAYIIVNEEYEYGGTKRQIQRVVPTIIYRSNSHGLWRSMPAINYDRDESGRLNFTKDSEDFTEHDLNLPHELQEYLAENSRNNTGSISDRLRRFLRRDKEKIDIKKLARNFAGETREYDNPLGFVRLSVGIEERVEPQISSLANIIKKSGYVISGYRTRNDLYGDIEAKVVKAGDLIITFFKTKFGIFVANVESSNSGMTERYPLNSTALSGIEEVLAPLIDHADEVNQGGDEYAVVSDENTPRIAKEIRKAGERFFFGANNHSPSPPPRRGWLRRRH